MWTETQLLGRVGPYFGRKISKLIVFWGKRVYSGLKPWGRNWISGLRLGGGEMGPREEYTPVMTTLPAQPTGQTEHPPCTAHWTDWAPSLHSPLDGLSTLTAQPTGQTEQPDKPHKTGEGRSEGRAEGKAELFNSIFVWTEPGREGQGWKMKY